MRIKATNGFERNVNMFLRTAQQTTDLGELASFNQLHMLINNLPGHSALPVASGQLQQKAFTKITRRHA